MQVHGRAR